MTVLLDTHVWIWSQVEPAQLGKKTQALLVDPKTELFVATISTLEIARLVEAGHITLERQLQEWIDASVGALRCQTLPLSHDTARGAYALPGSFHKDPADRILVATARHHDLTLLTADQRIIGYRHVRTRDARK